jgi:hypothetical protein
MLPDPTNTIYKYPEPGYRFLHVGELRERGDEYWSAGMGPWKYDEYPAAAGREVALHNVPFRRKIKEEIVI